jgi:hypothetical protein
MALLVQLLVTALHVAEAAPPRECQPMLGDLRFVPQFHAIPEMVQQRATDKLWWPGQANDANAVFEHGGVAHIMFQTDCTALDANPGGICAGGKVNAHAFSHLVSEDGGVHWRRLTDALIPTPGSPYDGFDGDCDGTVSFPEGIGPVILWGADCGTGKWPPKPPGPPAPVPPGPPASSHHRRSLTTDYPRVAVAMAINHTDPLLQSWRKTVQNPVVWSDPTQPCSFPGRVWRSDPKLTGKPAHWSMVGAGAREGPKPTTMADWNRYETTDPLLHGPWVLAVRPPNPMHECSELS